MPCTISEADELSLRMCACLKAQRHLVDVLINPPEYMLPDLKMTFSAQFTPACNIVPLLISVKTASCSTDPLMLPAEKQFICFYGH